MSTAIYIAALILADAINPGINWAEQGELIAWLFTGFVIYDVLKLGSKS